MTVLLRMGAIQALPCDLQGNKLAAVSQEDRFSCGTSRMDHVSDLGSTAEQCSPADI